MKPDDGEVLKLIRDQIDLKMRQIAYEINQYGPLGAVRLMILRYDGVWPERREDLPTFYSPKREEK